MHIRCQCMAANLCWCDVRFQVTVVEKKPQFIKSRGRGPGPVRGGFRGGRDGGRGGRGDGQR